jgi:hypothetical protein
MVYVKPGPGFDNREDRILSGKIPVVGNRLSDLGLARDDG